MCTYSFPGRLPVTVITFILLFAPFFLSGADPALDSIYQRILYHEYSNALTETAAYQGEHRDEALFLRGTALEASGRNNDARETYLALARKFPDSNWARKARYRAGDLYMKQKNYQSAWKIFSQALGQLSATGRQSALARRYKQLADELSLINLATNGQTNQSALDTKTPSYSRAARYYEEALKFRETGSNLKQRLGISLAYSYLHQDSYNSRRKAAAILEKMLEDNPPEDMRLLAEARFYLGQCYQKNRQYWKARLVCYQLARMEKAGSFAPRAAFILLELYNFPKPQNAADLRKGAAVADYIVNRFPGYRDTPRALLLKAKAYMHKNRFRESAQSCRTLLDKFPDHETAAEAAFTLGKTLLALKQPEDARKIFRSFLARYPSSEHWQNVQRMLIDIAFREGDELYKNKEYQKALKEFQDFQKQYPLDQRNVQAMFHSGQCHAALSNYQKAVSVWENLASKYQNPVWKGRALLAAADTCARHLEDFEKAFRYYKQVQKITKLAWQYRGRAKKQIELLQSQQLALETDKVFLSTEAPAVQIKVRNTKSLQVKVFRLDLQTYFRKAFDIFNVHNLDIELIDPDHQFVWNVPDYKKYRLAEHKIPLAEENKPGAYLVHCSSKKHKATTLVIVSDIGLIVRASRGEIFGSVSDLKSGQPLGDARILLADPKTKKIIARRQTDKSGIFRYRPEEEKRPTKIAVLATKNGHVAAAIPGRLPAYLPEKSRFLSHLVTDRPVYRPGDRIRWQLTARHRREGRYSVPGEKYLIRAASASGVSLYEQVHNFSVFGTMSGSFPTDPALPASELVFSVLAASNQQLVASHQIPVERYSPKQTDVSFSRDKTACFPGDTITLTIRLKRLFGVSAPEADFRYRINKDNWETARTGRDGSYTLKIDSSRYAEKSGIDVQVIPGWSTRTFNYQIPLLKQEFALAASLIRENYLTDEEIVCDIQVSAAPGISPKQQLKARVVRISEGREHEVLEKEIESTSSGKAKIAFSGAQPGRYSISIGAKSSSGESIRAETHCRLLDPDTIDLLLLPEKQHYTLDRKHRLSLYWGKQPVQALVTIERDSVLTHSRVSLKEGRQSIPLDFAPEHYPNARVAVSVVTREGSYFKAIPVKLKRNMQLSFSRGPQKQYAPGEQVSLEIESRDQNGNTLSGEMLVLAIDDAVFSAVNTNIVNINTVFARAYSFKGMQHAGFTPFAYKAKTVKRIDELVELDEAEEKQPESPASKRRTLRGLEPSKNAAAENRGRRKRKADQTPGIYDKGGYRRDGGARKPEEAETARQEAEKLARLSGLAFYKSRLQTDSDGRLQVNFRLPDNTLSRWRILIVGASRNAHFGMLQKTFATSTPVFAEIRAPEMLYRGDTLQVQGSIINSDTDGIDGTLVWSTTGSIAEKQKGTVLYSLGGGERKNFSVPLKAGTNDTIRLEIKSQHFRETRRIRVAARSQIRRKSRTGIAETSVLLPSVSFPDGSSQELYVSVHPVAKALFREAALFGNTFPGRSADLLRLCGRYLYQKKFGNNNEQRHTRSQIRNLLNHFLLLSHENWQSPDSPQPSFEEMAFLGFALGSCAKLEIPVPEKLQEALYAHLKAAFQSAGNRESKALILFALAWHTQADFAYLNSLYRQRDSLQNRELALLTTALALSKRQSMARELGTTLEKRFSRKDNMAWLPAQDFRSCDWWHSPREHTSLGLLALLLTREESSLIQAAARWLLDRHHILRSFPAEHSLTAYALARHLVRDAREQGSGPVELVINGNKLATLNPAGNQQENSITLTAAAQPNIKTARNMIKLIRDGKGSFFYTVETRARNPKAGASNTLQTRYLYPPLQRYGKEIKPGYTILSESYTPRTQDLKKTAVDNTFTVKNTLNTPDKKGGSYLLRQSIPPGCRLLPDTLKGNIRYQEQAGKTLRFWVYVPRGQNTISVEYTLQALLPGKLEVPPAELSLLSQSGASIQGAAHPLTILPRGSNFRENYLMSPDEMYNLGLLAVQHKEYTKGLTLLEDCLTQWKLDREPYKKTLVNLLDACIALNDEKKTVRYFEILKERFPERILPLSQARQVADAYKNMGEYERSCQILISLIDAFFVREARISGAYQNENRIRESSAFMESLFFSYPDLPIVRTTYYSLAQQLFSRATDSDAATLKKQKLDRQQLFEGARNLFTSYLSLFPEAPDAPEAAFSLLSLLVEEEQYQKARELAGRFSTQFAKSTFLDAFQFISAYAHFFQRQFQEAISYVNELATKKYKKESGEMKYSRYRPYAIHMLGKIFHSLHKFPKAIREYSRVKDNFADAARSITFLESRKVHIPEVTTFPTGKSTKLSLYYKGVQTVRLTVYKVDFMVLCLKERNLNNITGVNLAGIKALYEKDISLSKERPWLGRKKDIALPISKKGAYLVVLKANGVESSGMVIVSDIALDVLEWQREGTVRVALRNIKDGSSVSGAELKFIGSNNKQFVSTKSDLRGMAEAEGLSGLSTIVGVHQGHYCFYRGTRPLASRSRQQPLLKQEGYERKARGSLDEQRRSIQKSNRSRWNRNIQQQRKGLKLKKLW